MWARYLSETFLAFKSEGHGLLEHCLLPLLIIHANCVQIIVLIMLGAYKDAGC